MLPNRQISNYLSFHLNKIGNFHPTIITNNIFDFHSKIKNVPKPASWSELYVYQITALQDVMDYMYLTPELSNFLE